MTMELTSSVQKWKGKVSTKLQKARADQIWPLFHDFFGIHKWFPGLPTSHGVHGVNGEPGCIRYTSGFGLKSTTSGPSWSKERLVSIDHDKMAFSYEMVDCNIGFKSYVSTVKVLPAADGGAAASVEWCISLDPVVGWKLEDLMVKYHVGLRLMVKKMEDALLL